MRKLMLSSAGLVALLVTSVAVAHGIEGAKTAKAVAGMFTAATSNVSTRTCTTSDGKAIVVTNGKYTGAAAGDPDLTGPITLRAHSVVNTTDSVGVVDGWLKIDVAAGRDTTASYRRSTTTARLPASPLAAPTIRRRVSSRTLGDLRCLDRLPGGKLGGGTASGSASSSAQARARPRTRSPRRPGARHDLRALVELDHRCRAHVRGAGRQGGSGDGEVQDR